MGAGEAAPGAPMAPERAPITIWDVLEDAEALAVLEDRLLTADLVAEFESVDGGALELDGSQGCVVGELSTGEFVVIKRSDQTVQGYPLGDVGLQWVRNEAAGYEVARLLGMQDLVLPTVLRRASLADGTKIEVAVRLYVEASPEGTLREGAPLAGVPTEQRARAALFDYIVEQSDRKVSGDQGGNWYVLVEPEQPEPRLLLFDHQLCFGARDGFGLSSGIWDMSGHQIGGHLDQVEALLTDDAKERLGALLPAEALDSLLQRARSLLN